jgi:hypothetical protein
LSTKKLDCKREWSCRGWDEKKESLEGRRGWGFIKPSSPQLKSTLLPMPKPIDAQSRPRGEPTPV